MILLIHDTRKVTAVDGPVSGVEHLLNKPVASAIFSVAREHPDEIIGWCVDGLQDQMDKEALPRLLYNRNMMLSYSVSGCQYLPSGIGYVEDSPYIEFPMNVRYPTWQMSAEAGVIYGSSLSKFSQLSFKKEPFGYMLNSIAKIGQPQGLLCYSEPALLKSKVISEINVIKGSRWELFKFVAHHYKQRWLLLLFLNFIIYEGKWHFWSLLRSWLFDRKRTLNIDLDPPEKHGSSMMTGVEMDVIIPTIGRKKYLHDVLKDLSAQTFLPKKVIIVEQNPEPGGTSELDYLHTTDWPFEIDHHFIHRTGACHARNLAISNTSAPWVFFADDDNRMRPDTLEQAIGILSTLRDSALTSSYIQVGEQKTEHTIRQWITFGAGNSFVPGEIARKLKFDPNLEFGYGEDKDYGMLLRKSGVDVIYHPFEITHLKAPIGGFRKKIEKPWDSAEIEPKPSPTVLYFRSKHNSKEQLKGYKLTLFLKYYREQEMKNPFSYYKRFKKRWNESVSWVKKMKNE